MPTELRSGMVMLGFVVVTAIACEGPTRTNVAAPVSELRPIVEPTPIPVAPSAGAVCEGGVARLKVTLLPPLTPCFQAAVCAPMPLVNALATSVWPEPPTCGTAAVKFVGNGLLLVPLAANRGRVVAALRSAAPCTLERWKPAGRLTFPVTVETLGVLPQETLIVGVPPSLTDPVAVP